MPEEEKKSLFTCNICLCDPSEPMATSCGHVFCWSCINDWLDQPTASKICPQCQNGISKDSLITLYGNADSSSNPRRRQSSAAPPPRPKPQRNNPQPQQPNANIPGFGGGFGGLNLMFFGGGPLGFLLIPLSLMIGPAIQWARG